jgi:hypothetical protein
MIIKMNETKLATLEQIREFLAGTTEVVFAVPAEEPRLRAFVAKKSPAALPDRFYQGAPASTGKPFLPTQ